MRMKTMENRSFNFTNSMYLMLNLISKWRVNKFIRKVVEYGINGTEPTRLNRTEKMVFETFKKQIQSEKQLSKVRSYAGKKGGAPKNNTNAVKVQEFTTKQAKNKQKQAKTSVITLQSLTVRSMYLVLHRFSCSV